MQEPLLAQEHQEVLPGLLQTCLTRLRYWIGRAIGRLLSLLQPLVFKIKGEQEKPLTQVIFCFKASSRNSLTQWAIQLKCTFDICKTKATVRLIFKSIAIGRAAKNKTYRCTHIYRHAHTPALTHTQTHTHTHTCTHTHTYTHTYTHKLIIKTLHIHFCRKSRSKSCAGQQGSATMTQITCIEQAWNNFGMCAQSLLVSTLHCTQLSSMHLTNVKQLVSEA